MISIQAIDLLADSDPPNTRTMASNQSKLNNAVAAKTTTRRKKEVSMLILLELLWHEKIFAMAESVVSSLEAKYKKRSIKKFLNEFKEIIVSAQTKLTMPRIEIENCCGQKKLILRKKKIENCSLLDYMVEILNDVHKKKFTKLSLDRHEARLIILHFWLSLLDVEAPRRTMDEQIREELSEKIKIVNYIKSETTSKLYRNIKINLFKNRHSKIAVFRGGKMSEMLEDLGSPCQIHNGTPKVFLNPTDCGEPQSNMKLKFNIF